MLRRWNIMVVLAAVALLVLPLGVVSTAGAETFEFKISIENNLSHPKTKALQAFVQDLIKKSDGRLKPTLYHSAQLYKDIHVAKAINMNVVQMGVVGNYLLDGYDINATVTHMPMFFGQPHKLTTQLIDGPVGEFVSKRLEEKLNVEVIGRCCEMGFDEVFTIKKQIKELEDFKGLRLRHSGGAIYTRIFKALGAEGVVISWPDVPMAMSRGTVDGLATTIKSSESAKLYECGLKYITVTRTHFSYYYPLVNRKFWNSLPKDLQKIFTDVYEEMVPKERKLAADQQIWAKEFLKTKGVIFYEPSDEKLAKWMKHIMPIQEGLIKELGYDPELVEIVKKASGM
jgi:C4-dicarboxylate-binding protein DctP